MILEFIEFAGDPGHPQPPRVSLIHQEATRRIDEFLAGEMADKLPGFVPSDFEEVAKVLTSLARSNLPNGKIFVEWGSGFGVAALMAAELGFEAYGIEFEHALVTEAEKLAKDFEVDVEFALGSFVPRGAQDLIDFGEGPEWLKFGGFDGHDDLELDPADVDVVFAYPWPGEAEVLKEIFDRISDVGALLLTWNGIDGIELHRKTN